MLTENVWPWSFLAPFMARDMYQRVSRQGPREGGGDQRVQAESEVAQTGVGRLTAASWLFLLLQIQERRTKGTDTTDKGGNWITARGPNGQTFYHNWWVAACVSGCTGSALARRCRAASRGCLAAFPFRSAPLLLTTLPPPALTARLSPSYLKKSVWNLTDAQHAAYRPPLDPYDNPLVMSLAEFVRHPIAEELLHNGQTYQVRGAREGGQAAAERGSSGCDVSALLPPSRRRCLASPTTATGVTQRRCGGASRWESGRRAGGGEACLPG